MDNLDYDNPSTPSVVNTTPKWVIIILLLVFPPIAFYFMWKEKKYHKWFVYLLIFVGGLTSVFGITQILFVTPKLLVLYEDFNTKIPPTHSVITYILIFIGIIEFSFGFYLKNKLKLESTSKKLLGTAVGMLLISYLFGGYLQAQSVLSVITPIYNLTSSFDNISPTSEIPNGGVAATTTPSIRDYPETSGWGEYKNEKYGFIIKYPPNWFVLKDDESGFRISNKTFDATLDGVSPIYGQMFIDVYYYHSALENYSESPIEYTSTEGVRLVKQGRYINDSESVGLVTTIRKSDADNISLTNQTDQIVKTFQFFDIFRTNKLNSNLMSTTPNLDLPIGLEKNQLSTPQLISDSYFVLFTMSSFNHPINSQIQRAGVLYADKDSSKWLIFYELLNTSEKDISSNKNNPYYFWKEGDVYYTIIIDSGGAGSGEGIAKLIRLDKEHLTWKTTGCFYYTPESFNQYINSLQNNLPFSQNILSYKESYILDKTLGKFTSSFGIVEHCSNFDINI